MDGHSKVIQVFTVDLNPALRASLDASLSQNTGIAIQHCSGWVFGMARADVLILDSNSGVGKEAMAMLRSFRRDKSACLVIYADEGSTISTRGVAGNGNQEMCAKITQALERAQQNLDNASVAATPAMERPHIF